MLSQDTSFSPAQRRTYRPTDIFHLSPHQSTERIVLDRNRSSVFDLDPIANQNSKVDRMASDLFFLKNGSGGYQPSQGKSRRATPREVEKHESHEEYAEPQYTSNVAETQWSEKEYYEPESFVRKESVTSLFGPEQPPLRGSRRHFETKQGSGIFENELPAPARQVYRAPVEEERAWVPSVKQTSTSTSFSNLFGDYAPIDKQNRSVEPIRLEKPQLSSAEKLRVFGLSSQDLNRPVRAKKRGTTESQIWF